MVHLWICDFPVVHCYIDNIAHNVVPNTIQKRKNNSHRPSYIGAIAYNSSDVIILAVAVTNTGVQSGALRMKLIVNGQWAFHHVDIKSLPIPKPNEPYEMNGDWLAPTPVVSNARETVNRFLGFTQNMKLQNFAATYITMTEIDGRKPIA